MIQVPSNIKFRKHHKGRVSLLDATRTNKLEFGNYGLQILEPARVTRGQLEAVRVAINRKLRRTGKVWFRVFPSIPVTSKPIEVRMGKGKGNVDYWMCRVRRNTIIVEFTALTKATALEAYRSASCKLGTKTKFVSTN